MQAYPKIVLIWWEIITNVKILIMPRWHLIYFMIFNLVYKIFGYTIENLGNWKWKLTQVVKLSYRLVENLLQHRHYRKIINIFGHTLPGSLTCSWLDWYAETDRLTYWHMISLTGKQLGTMHRGTLSKIQE